MRTAEQVVDDKYEKDNCVDGVTLIRSRDAEIAEELSKITEGWTDMNVDTEKDKIIFYLVEKIDALADELAKVRR